MPQPYDYRLDVPDPVGQVLSGVQSGQNLRLAREQRKATEVATQKQADFEAASAALGPGSTADEYAEVARMLPPEQQAPFLETFSLLNAEQKANKLAFSSQLLSATISSPDVASNMAREQATAERGSGNEEQAKAWDTTAKIIEADPEGAFHAMAVMVSGLEGGSDAVQAALDAQSEIIEQKKTAADIEATELETDLAGKIAPFDRAKTKEEIEKLKAETAKLVAERDQIIDDVKNAGEMTPEDVIKNEDKLKEFYTKSTKESEEIRRQLNVIKNAAIDSTGQGDLSMIFAFMKMLDPTSVVRESEYAAAANAQGFYNKLLMTYDKIESGQFLEPKQRAKFLSLAQKFMHHSEGVAEQEYWLAHDTAKDRGLDPKHIFTNKDITLFTKKGKPDPEKYKFGDDEITEAIASLDEMNEELGASAGDYTKFRSFKEDE